MVYDMKASNADEGQATGSELLTVEETARVLRSSAYTVRRMLRAGTIRGVKLGNRWRISRSALRSRVGLN